MFSAACNGSDVERASLTYEPSGGDAEGTSSPAGPSSAARPISGGSGHGDNVRQDRASSGDRRMSSRRSTHRETGHRRSRVPGTCRLHVCRATGHLRSRVPGTCIFHVCGETGHRRNRVPGTCGFRRWGNGTPA